jgi:hypothetical protein
MATRTTVLTKIAAINDNGNNTAVEVRDVLTELLNYTENQTFHIFSEAPINSTENNAKLFFSIKGVIGETANLTMMIKPLRNNVEQSTNMNFVIPFNQTIGMFTIANFNLLAAVGGIGIIPLFDDGNYLSYTVPFINDSGFVQGNIIVVMVRSYEGVSNSLAISVSNARNTSISTSIAMHWQKFSESLFNINVINTTGTTTNLASGPRVKKGVTKAESFSFLEKIFGLNFK